MKTNGLGEIRQGVNSFADVAVSAVRGAGDVAPSLAARADLASRVDLCRRRSQQQLSGGHINLGYDFTKQTLEIAEIASAVRRRPPSRSTGAIIDLDKLNPAVGKGFGIDLLISGGTAAPVGSGEQPLPFDIQTTGRYLVASRELQFARHDSF